MQFQVMEDPLLYLEGHGLTVIDTMKIHQGRSIRWLWHKEIKVIYNGFDCGYCKQVPQSNINRQDKIGIDGFYNSLTLLSGISNLPPD